MNKIVLNLATGEQTVVPLTAEDIAQAQLDAAAFVGVTYAAKRAMEYPSIADYLDGVVKGDQAQIDKYIADCQAVKLKYPKPE